MEIDLGDGITAEIVDGEIALTDEITEDTITLTMEAFDRLVAFVAEHRSKP